ncbi:MAG TPA: helicase C-terminal domain-containing protein [Micromonosporaceae bacterium]|nr:helicase C-terminal domain-containing protein [Micromonosporaceae bacterium]
MASKLSAWLGTLTAERLAEVLSRRSDATASPVPRTVGELAERLQSRESVTIVLQALPLPAAQVIEALQALGGPSVSRERLAATLGRTADDPDLGATLDVLALRALVWPDRDDLCMAGPLWSAFRHPLRLGPPMERLYATRTPTELGRFATTLGLPAGRSRKRTLDELVRWAGDGERVRATVDRAPKSIRTLLHQVAWEGPGVIGPGLGHGYGYRPDPAVSWALDRGLLVPDGWQGAVMPGEIGAALRGPDWRAPFTPYPPQPPLSPAPPAAVAQEAAATAGAAVATVTMLLDTCADTPVTLLKAGGVGVRELRRLARVLAGTAGGPAAAGATAAGRRPRGSTASRNGPAGRGGPATGDEATVRLWLELAANAGLLGTDAGVVLPTEAYDEWCATEPAQRLVPLLRAWLSLPAAPLAGQDPEADQPAAALTYHMSGEAVADLRRELLRAAADLPEGQGFADGASLAELMAWRCPLLQPALGEAAPLVSATWQEATLLGVVAHGALTPLGRALVMDGAPADGSRSLAAVATRLLPAAVPSALFQADLTAVVPGTPAAALSALLDSAADRESRGGAAIWRFSPGSVRRALDAGQSGPGLLDALRAVANGAALPQPLEYLVLDVARRHGQLRVRSVTCVVLADDPALLTEIAAVRSLAQLRLALLAPTVLGSGKPAKETLAALRAAGYAPVTESATGGVVVERAARRRAAVRPRRGRGAAAAAGLAARPGGQQPATDPGRLARALLATAPTGARTGDAPGTSAGPARPGRRGQPHLHLVRDDPAAASALVAAAPKLGKDPVFPLVRHSSGPVPDSPADLVATGAPQLNRAEQRLLAEALEHAGPVKIVYTNAQGGSSVRVIEPLHVSGHLIEAWCHLRDEERMFALDRIEAVGPA